MTIEELAQELRNFHATILIDTTAEFKELCDKLEPVFDYHIPDASREIMLKRGYPLNIFGFAMYCFDDCNFNGKKFNTLTACDGVLDGYTLETAEILGLTVIKASDFICGTPSATDELTKILFATNGD